MYLLWAKVDNPYNKYIKNINCISGNLVRERKSLKYFWTKLFFPQPSFDFVLLAPATVSSPLGVLLEQGLKNQVLTCFAELRKALPVGSASPNYSNYEFKERRLRFYFKGTMPYVLFHMDYFLSSIACEHLNLVLLCLKCLGVRDWSDSGETLKQNFLRHQLKARTL